MSETKKESKFFFIVLFIVIVAIFYIGLKFKKETEKPEGIITEPLVQKKVISIQDVKLDTEFLETDKFKALKSPIKTPIQAGETGKSDLF